jgi:16S rRNA (uracil1498-N3)-methyltransferase
MRDVLRLKASDEVAVSDGAGRQVVARIAKLTSKEAVLDVVREMPVPFVPDVTLVQGVCRGPKMDLLVEKTTELGVARIVPVVTKRCVVKLDKRGREDKASRWRKIAESASKQSQRATLPAIDEVGSLSALTKVLSGFDHVLVPWEEEHGEGIGEALSRLGATSASSVAVVIGPEGGLEAGEVEHLAALGAAPVTLGDTILRTETAGIVAVALLSYELGGLGGARRD